MTHEQFKADVFRPMEKDQWEIAAVHIARYFHEDPLDDEIRSLCGLIYSTMDWLGVEFQPMTSEEFLWRGITGRETRDLFETLRDYGKAVVMNPQNHYALKWRANWYHNGGVLWEAKKDLLSAISISAQAEYYWDLSKVYISERDYESALFYNKKAVKLRPGYNAYLFNTGWLLHQLGKVEKAQPIFDKLNVSVDYWNPLTGR